MNKQIQKQIRQKQQEKLHKSKKAYISPKSNEKPSKWNRNTTRIVADSMLSGTVERRISKWERKVKVKNFLGATIDGMYDYIKPLLKKIPADMMSHVWTNNSVNESSKVALGKLLDLKKFNENILPESNVIISNLLHERIMTRLF